MLPLRCLAIRCILAAALAASSLSWALADAPYVYTPLGIDFRPYRVSESGQVVGAAEFGRNPALLWRDGVVETLGPGAAHAMNNAGDIVISALEREVKLAGEPLELTPREFDLLLFFASNPGKVFSRSELLDRVWGHQHSGYEHTVNTHINRIRAKIELDPATPRRILTVWGRGYKLSAEERER